MSADTPFFQDIAQTGWLAKQLQVLAWTCGGVALLLGVASGVIGWRKTTLEKSRDGPRLVSPSDRKSTRLNSSHQIISYAVFSLKKKHNNHRRSSIIYTLPDNL